MRDIRMGIFFVLFIGLFVAIMAFVFFDKPIQTITRAGAQNVAIDKSLVIASKLEAKADKQDTVEVTVFARNSEGVSLENKSIAIASTLGTLSTTSGFSDKYGRVVFVLSSATSGKAVLTATIDGQKLPQPLTIQFVQ